MATVPATLTLEEFRNRYGVLKPHYEYWNGQAFQKALPTWLHSLIQSHIRDLLAQAGYESGVEIRLQSDPRWQPVPDVIGAREIELPYPTEPVDVVVEVLSPSDEAVRTLNKCQQYSRIGVQAIFVIDPDGRKGWRWNAEQYSLDGVEDLILPNGNRIELAAVWSYVTRRLASAKKP